MLVEKVGGQVEDLLELAVPRNQVLPLIEHGDSIAHILERDAELFLALPNLIEQPCVLHRDHRLSSEVLQQYNLPIAKRPDFLSIDVNHPREQSVFSERHRQTTPGST